MEIDIKIIEQKYSKTNIKLDISEIINDWFLNYSSEYNSFLVTKDYILQQNKKLFSKNFWKSDVVTDTIRYSYNPEIKFGTNSGIIFRGTNVYFIDNDGSGYINFNLNDLKEITFENILKRNLIKIEDGFIKKFYDYSRFIDGGMGLGHRIISTQEISLIKDITEFILLHVNTYNNEILKRKRFEDEIRLKKEIEKEKVLKLKKYELTNQLDKDGNGEVDLVDGESFNKLLTRNQKNIIEIDKNYIQKFVKISLYLKTKKSNTQKIFNSIKNTKSDTELNELINLLKNQIHTYELLVFHSINMITSLVDSDLITFYEIYECFDQLGVFNSNWENEVSDKLTNIGDGIKDLMYSIYQMENKIVNSIDNLTYVTQDSFKELNMSVNNQLSSIDSSIKFNNLLTGIQTYQMYKINQNTKRIG